MELQLDQTPKIGLGDVVTFALWTLLSVWMLLWGIVFLPFVLIALVLLAAAFGLIARARRPR